MLSNQDSNPRPLSALTIKLRRHFLNIFYCACVVGYVIYEHGYVDSLQTCSSRPVLRTHVRMVHRNARAQRNHVCHTCGKAYTTKKSLEGHMRSHSGERPFRCALCASAFGYEAALYNHNKLVHLKTKTGRAYTQQSKATLEKPNEIL
ncbi:hypothetical protein K1T71_000569 [Dendrolimus kikuchii]|uniref:Uncharacterized protein n=1 Tax=Dendrolimus kikuchii TaxID=765133 RepID=A0ACC1DJY9_9NEOP|nr:hypothetical protein K1T71_000569 [Dendrolimus kikuchii]